ncbi:hypothetical protein HQ590_16860 [bacterium]|nr:hypothetical protein [bacterium]
MNFTKIADYDTAIPGGTGNFTSFGELSAALSGSTVAFRGSVSGEQNGIYTGTGSGALAVVADLNSGVPGGTGNFTGFGSSIFISGSTVAFWGYDPDSRDGMYTANGTLTVVADEDTAIPGGTGNFTGMGEFAALSGNTMAFHGNGSGGQHGIYTGNGALTAVADLTTTVPGGTGNFTILVEPVISGGTVVFAGYGSDGENGIYTGNGALAAVADLSTAIPGGTGNFTGLSDPVISGSTVVFHGNGAGGQSGVYSDDGTLSLIADRNTAIPGGSGDFTYFEYISVSGSTVAFESAGSDNQQGIYLYLGGTLYDLIDANDMLDGKNLMDIDLFVAGLDGNSLAFTVHYLDSSMAIYRADFSLAAVPEPSVVSLLFGGGLLVWRLGQVKRKSLPAR